MRSTSISKKQLFISIFFLVCALIGSAKTFPAIITLKDGAQFEDEINLKFKSKTILTTASGSEYNCEDVMEVLLKESKAIEVSIRLVPIKSYRGGGTYVWGMPIVQGRASLYNAISAHPSLRVKKLKEEGAFRISTNGGIATVMTRDGFTYKGTESFMYIEVERISYLQGSAEMMFEDCPEMLQRVKNKEYTVATAEQMVNDYNAMCGG